MYVTDFATKVVSGNWGPAVNAAIDVALSIGTNDVLWTAGDYVASGIVLKSGVTLRGQGIVNVQHPTGTGATSIISSTGHDMTVRGINFDGNKPAIYSGGLPEGILLQGATNVTIEQCGFKNFVHGGVTAQNGSTGIIVQDCTFTNNGYSTGDTLIGADVWIFAQSQGQVLRCTSSGSWTCVNIDDRTVSPTIYDGQCFDSVVKDCVINAQVGVLITGVRTSCVVNCDITAGRGIEVYPSQGDPVTPATAIVLENNILRNGDFAGGGIVLGQYTSLIWGINNTFINCVANINDASAGNPINVTPDSNGQVVYNGITYQRTVTGNLVQFVAL